MKYGESSLILDIYTEEYGLHSYIIGGVRSKKSKTKAGGLQIMSLVELIAYHKNTKALFRIKEIQPTILYKKIPFEILRSSVGQFMIELLKQVLKDTEENAALFLFIVEWFYYLDDTPHKVSNVHLRFMIELAELIGIQPRDNYSVHRPYFDLSEGQFIEEERANHHCLNTKTSELIYDLMMSDRESLHDLNFSNEERRNILDKLIQFYNLHIEAMKPLNTHQILNEILT